MSLHPTHHPGRPAAPTAEPLPETRGGIGSVFAAARPKQWIKNVLILAAPAAAGVLDKTGALLQVGVALLAFSLLSSGAYLMNDVMDAPADRLHPVKRHRPVASGRLTRRAALAAALGLAVVALTLALVDGWPLALVLASYAGLQVAYGLWLKHQPVYDIATVAAGFVLRAIAGGVAVHVAVSEWFLIVATFGSLLMVAGKRRAEQIELGPGRGRHRATLELYTAGFLQVTVGVAVAGAILGYCQWALGLETALKHGADPIWFQLSVVPVILALLRYTYLVEQGHGGRPEDVVLADRSLVVLAAVWAGFFGMAIYGT